MEIKKIDFEVEDSLPQKPDAQPETSTTPSTSTPTPSIDPQISSKKPKPIIIGLFALALVLGVSSGVIVKKITTSSPGSNLRGVDIDESSLKVGDSFGVDDTDLFPDTVTGYLEKGGINGEGTHSLLRLGGVSQTVYLTSSIVDLDEFVGHQVTIWGETFSGQKAGWLMDVGRVRVDELNAEAPEE